MYVLLDSSAPESSSRFRLPSLAMHPSSRRNRQTNKCRWRDTSGDVQVEVRDLMTTQVVTLKADETVKKAVLKLALDNISGAPVVDNRNHLLGILSENDILHMIMAYQIKLDRENSDSVMLTYSMDSSNEPDKRLRMISEEISNKPVSEIMTRTVLTTSPLSAHSPAFSS